MWPELTTVPLPHGGRLPITTYGVLVLAATVIAWVLARRRTARFGLQPFDGMAIVLLAVIGGMVGARIVYILFNLRWFLADPIGMLTLEGGLVWYGGLAGGAAAVIAYARRYGIALPVLFDFSTPLVALSHGIGRVGCFLVGCCYGRSTPGAFGVRFPPSAYYRGPTDVALHPVQLYEAAFELALAAVLFRVGRGPRGGRVLALYLAAYAPFRLLIELTLRGDDRGTLGLPVPPSAAVSAAALAVAALLWRRSSQAPGLTRETNPR